MSCTYIYETYPLHGPDPGRGQLWPGPGTDRARPMQRICFIYSMYTSSYIIVVYLILSYIFLGDPILLSSGNLCVSPKATDMRSPKERSMGLPWKTHMGLPQTLISDFLWGSTPPEMWVLRGWIAHEYCFDATHQHPLPS